MTLPDWERRLTRDVSGEVAERLDVLHVPLEPRSGRVDASEPQCVGLTQDQGSVHLTLDDRVIHLE